VDWLDLPVPRPLVTVRGRLDDLLTDDHFAGHADHWVRAEYTDSTPQPDPMRRLQARFPWCATVVHLPAEARLDDGADYSRRVRAARDDAEVVDAFLEHVREGEGASSAERELIREVLDARAIAEARA
jgi:exonuclease SbcD